MTPDTFLSSHSTCPDVLLSFLNELNWKIGTFGGRRLTSKKHKDSFCLNDIIKNTKFTSQPGYKIVLDKIKDLDRSGALVLSQANLIKRIITKAKSFFSHLIFNRQKRIDQLELLYSQPPFSDSDLKSRNCSLIDPVVIKTSDYLAAVKTLGEKLQKRNREDCYLLDFPLLYSYLQPYSQDIKLVIKRWFGEFAFNKLEKIFKQFSLSDECFILFLQPGIACHIKEFYEFLSKNNSSFRSPFELREAFSKYLGKRTFFRAMYLTPEDKSKFMNKTQPIYNAISRQEESFAGLPYAKIFAYLLELKGSSYEKEGLGEGNTMMHQLMSVVQSFFNWRLHRSDGDLPSPFIPTSPYRDVANHVAYWLCEESQKQEKELVILELEIPIIEVVGNKGVFFLAPTANRTCCLENEQGAEVSISAHDYEYLVYGNIPSSNICKVNTGYVPQKRFKYVRNDQHSYESQFPVLS